MKLKKIKTLAKIVEAKIKNHTSSTLFLKSMKNNSQGMAILLVLSSVTLLAFLLAEFTFDTQINKLRVTNKQDASQARLNAEAGLKLALARLDIYKEARNLLEKKPDQKKNFPNSIINQIFSIPFIYPIPISESMNVIQKEALTEFLENTLIRGGLRVTVTESSGLINLNLLRLHGIKDFNKLLNNNQSDQNDDDASQGDTNQEENEEDSPILGIEKKIKEILKNEISTRSEKDDDFANEFGDTDVERLVQVLKYYVNEKDSLTEDPNIGDAEQDFSNANLNPKHAALTSLSELYLLPGWNDQLVELIENEVTVHGNKSIDLNKITKKLVKLIIPEITVEQLDEFFEWKNNPEDPQSFDELKDFKKYFVDNAIVESDDFDKKIDEFKKAGLTFGGSSNLFRVVSTGTSGRADYQLNAWVTMPLKPPPPPKPKKGEKDNDSSSDDKSDDQNSSDNSSSSSSSSNDDSKKKKRVIQFLSPRIVELLAN